MFVSKQKKTKFGVRIKENSPKTACFGILLIPASMFVVEKMREDEAHLGPVHTESRFNDSGTNRVLMPYRSDEPTESAHRIHTGSNQGSNAWS